MTPSRPVKELKVLSYNVDGLSKEKYEIICKQVIVNYDVVVLVETFASAKQQYTCEGYVSYAQVRKRNVGAKRNSGGVLIMVRSEIATHCKLLTTSSVDILWLRIIDLCTEGNIILGGIYCSPINSKAVHGNFYQELESDLYRHVNGYPNDKIILAGDFNARTGNLKDVLGDYLEPRNVSFGGSEFLRDSMKIGERVNSDTEVNAYGRSLIHLCQEFNLCMGNGRLGDDKQVGQFTCVTWNGASTVDYLLFSHSFLDCLVHFEILDISEFSVHFPLAFTIQVFYETNVAATVAYPVHPGGHKLEQRMKYKWNDQEKDAFLNKLEQNRNVLQSLEAGCERDIESSLDVFYNTIDKCASSMKTICRPNSYKKVEKQNAPFFDEECAAAKSKMTKALKKFRIAVRVAKQIIPDTHNIAPANNDIVDAKLSEFQVAKFQYKELIKNKKKTFTQERESLAQSFSQDNNKFWDFYKGNKRSNCRPATKDAVEPDQWISHMENLFCEPSVTVNRMDHIENTNSMIDINELECDISQREIEIQFKKLKNNKSPGPDGLCSQFFKLGQHVLMTFILMLFNGIFACGYFPLKWAESLVFMLHKKGVRSDPDNYRSISLLNIIGKVFAGILQSRLYRWCQKHSILSENQYGFRSGRSTVDCLFIHNTLVQYHLSKKRGKLYVCYIDFSKAFDSVSWEILWYKLNNLGINNESRFLKILKGIYKIVSCRVITPWGLTPSINLFKGVRQGCILSPLLFALFIDDVKKWLNEVVAHEFSFEGNTPVTHLLFADDLALFSQSVVGLQRMIDCLSNYCKKYNMKINIEKTKIMVFRKGGRPGKKESWHLDGHKIQIVSKFRYLGLLVSNSGVWTSAVTELANRAKKALFCVKNFLYTSKIQNTNIALKLFDACVSPVFNYGAQIWGFHQSKDIDRVCDNFYKYVTRLPTNANNIAARGELGRSRSYCKRYILIIKYWLKLIRESSELPLFLKSAYQLQCKLDSRGHTVWVSDVRSLLCSLGFSEEWTKQQVEQPKIFLEECKKRLFYLENVAFMTNIAGSPRLQLYFHSKTKLEKSDYWDQQLPFKFKAEFCKLLCSSHSLAIEVGRRTNIPRENRTCSLCSSGEVEDEVHFILKCPKFAQLRSRYIQYEYLTRPGLNALISLFINPEKCEQLMKYYFFASKQRDRLINLQ